jgi:Raf kinase inhibitor-like YbhB/YbcL family protein
MESQSAATAEAVPNFTATSSMMRDGETVPMTMVYSSTGCTGDNLSPDLRCSGAPEETKSYAVTMFDLDARSGAGLSHWVAYDIPAHVTSLEAGAGSLIHKRLQGTHGINDFGEARYDGPCPPLGDPPHHYHVTVYAIVVPVLRLRDGATYAAFRSAARGLVAAQGEIVSLYGR